MCHFREEWENVWLLVKLFFMFKSFTSFIEDICFFFQWNIIISTLDNMPKYFQENVKNSSFLLMRCFNTYWHNQYMSGSVYLFKSNVNTEMYAYIKYMYGEFPQKWRHTSNQYQIKERKKETGYYQHSGSPSCSLKEEKGSYKGS